MLNGTNSLSQPSWYTFFYCLLQASAILCPSCLNPGRLSSKGTQAKWQCRRTQKFVVKSDTILVPLKMGGSLTLLPHCKQTKAPNQELLLLWVKISV